MIKWIVKSFTCCLVLFFATNLLAQQSTAEKSGLDLQLLAAAKRGDTAMVDSLLQQGAKVDAVDTQQSSRTALILAASGGYVETLKRLLAHGANVNARDEYDNTALTEAVPHGYTQIVQLLLDRHADVEVMPKYSSNALALAAANGHADIVKLLLDSGARIDAADDNGTTALMWASGRSVETAKLLLDRNANIESKDKSGYSAIFYAAGWGKTDILKLLIDHGADVTIRGTNGITVLDNGAGSCSKEIAALLRAKGAKFDAGGSRDLQLVFAAESGQIDIVKQLLDQGTNAGGVAGSDTPLSRAAYCGQTDVADLLLSRGANVDGVDKDKDSPLIKAAYQGQAQTVALLLNKHANPNFAGNFNTPLTAAATRNPNTETIKLLLDKGARIDSTNSAGATALINAAASGAVDGPVDNVALLLDRHANTEAENKYGQTALGEAAKQGRVQIVKLLLDRGANINGGSKGGPLLQLMPEYGGLDLGQKQLQVLKLLLDRGANVAARDADARTVLMNAAENGRTAAVRLLLDGRAEIDAQDNLGQTALFKAAMGGHADTVQLLLERGANANAADKQGDTALIRAAGGGHADVVRLLIEKGANLQAQGQSGRPALNEAAEYGREEVVKLLLDKGADIETRDKCEWTPLMDAIWEQHVSTVKLLLSRGANATVKAKAGCGGGIGEQTPLKVACSQGSIDITGLLIDKGVNVDPMALSDAVYGNKLELVRFLLDKRTNPDLRGDWRDEVQTPLVLAASQGATDMVKLLLDRGANIDARDKYGYTALMRAITQYNVNTRSYGYYEIAKLLLDRGADPSATNNYGQTALMLVDGCASCIKPSPQIVELLKDVRHTPRQEFEEEVARLAQTPDDAALLDKIIKFATDAAPPPAIPETARQSLVEGATLMRQGHVQEARDKFESAIKIAPWWADAYYNDAIADEKLGWYDDASRQLEKYLKFPLSDADSRDAHDRLYALSAEKEAHKKDQENYLREAAVKYVTGGAQRVDENDAPSAWKSKDGCTVECLYAYRQNTMYVDHYYQNLFRMPNGHYIAVVLQGALSGDGSYIGDRVLVAEITDGRQWAGEYSFGALNEQFHPGSGSTYKVSVSERSANGVVSVTETQSGAEVTIPLADLYNARYVNAFYTWNTDYQKLGDKTYNVVPEGGRTVASALFFSDKLDYGHADSLSLMPSYVVVLDQRDHPIGNTGYFLRWHGNAWRIEK